MLITLSLNLRAIEYTQQKVIYLGLSVVDGNEEYQEVLN